MGFCKVITFIALISCVLMDQGFAYPLENILQRNENKFCGLQNVLRNIYEEQSYDSLVILHSEGGSAYFQFEEVYQMDLPKLILSKDMQFLYKDYFNSEILVILYGPKEEKVWMELLSITSGLLQYMRQSRILILTGQYWDYFQADFFNKIFEEYRMTNVMLMRLAAGSEKPAMKKLRPYPEYHWENWQGQNYFPPQWLNLHNKTLWTIVEQTSSRSFVYIDSEGNFRMNGYVARLVMLFAAKYNASLEMYYPLKAGNQTHYTIINQLVGQNKLDLPMAMIPAIFEEEWRNVSDTFDINEIMLMVPLGEPLSMLEIFGALLNDDFFACYVIMALIFSALHGLIEYLWGNLKNPWDFLLNTKAWPGVLGQAFDMVSPSQRCLKILYLLNGFYGLYMATQFSANVNTYFTQPPHHRQINTYEDLLHSKKKILINTADAHESDDWLYPYQASLQYTDNITYLHEQRRRLNTTYCYYATTASYQLVWRQQKYSSHQLFHTPKAMTYFNMLPWGFRLQLNSPYKQALNSLIHRVHSAGLITAWHDSLFWDMLKLNEVSMRDLNPTQYRKVLTAEDLFWVWMIVVIGMACSSAVFLFELLVKKKWGK
ncbi:uncharacterized protein LOC133337361 [Musca vetustissima]|uniref:uncharacterized protein LOC133337361 n=1 Tax=Musca vetustissima TaxID=27455 RepID=UPI002AB60A9C|nr:uncharacterized protein LOC133337361 [Musca vetustissima]